MILTQPTPVLKFSQCPSQFTPHLPDSKHSKRHCKDPYNPTIPTTTSESVDEEIGTGALAYPQKKSLGSGVENCKKRTTNINTPASPHPSTIPPHTECIVPPLCGEPEGPRFTPDLVPPLTCCASGSQSSFRIRPNLRCAAAPQTPQAPPEPLNATGSATPRCSGTGRRPRRKWIPFLLQIQLKGGHIQGGLTFAEQLKSSQERPYAQKQVARPTRE